MKYYEFEKKLRDKFYYMPETHQIFENILEDIKTHGDKLKYVSQFLRRQTINPGWNHAIHHTILVDATHIDALSVYVYHISGCRLEFNFSKYSKDTSVGTKNALSTWEWNKTIQNAMYGNPKYFIFEMRDKID